MVFESLSFFVFLFIRLINFFILLVVVIVKVIVVLFLEESISLYKRFIIFSFFFFLRYIDDFGIFIVCGGILIFLFIL